MISSNVKYSRNIMSQPSGQQGAVLLVGLVMLMIVTLIGVSSMQTVTLDEKIVSNMQSATMAYHGSEAALSACEANLQANEGNVYALGSFPAGWRDDLAFWQSSKVSSVVQFTGLDVDPSCMVEFIGDGGADVDVKGFYKADNPASRPTFRVTSYSKGGDTAVDAMVESVFICPGGCSQSTSSAQPY